MLINVPNILSLMRFPLAFLFLQDNVLIRVIAVVLAMITDWLDGFLARRYHQTTTTGRLLDPLTDKFFVCFILTVFVFEGQIKIWEALTFFTRDLSVLIFGCYLLLSDKFKTYQFPPFWSGKIITSLQLALLLLLTLQIAIPSYFFIVMFLLGCLSFIELFIKSNNLK